MAIDLARSAQARALSRPVHHSEALIGTRCRLFLSRAVVVPALGET